MQVELVSPEAVLFSGECSQVVARTVDGDIAFLDNHAPFIGALDIGQTQLWANDGVVSLAINGGFVEVSGNSVTILSDGALASQDIDIKDALMMMRRQTLRSGQKLEFRSPALADYTRSVSIAEARSLTTPPQKLVRFRWR